MADESALTRAFLDELIALDDYKPGKRVDAAGLTDVLFAYRVLLGRMPEFNTVEQFRERLGGGRLADFALSFIRSPEFKSRFPEDPGYDLKVMVELPDRLRMWFHWRDRQAARIAATGGHEPTTLAAMRSVLRRGMNCLDIGAHVGFYALVMAHATGAAGKVFAFEPFPSTYDLLQRNIEENRFADRIRAFRVACSDHPGHGSIFVPLQDDLGPSFVPVQKDVPPAQGLEGTDVELARVDDLVPRELHIGLIKMDIEGAEPRALRGMDRIVANDRPHIVTEFNPYCLRNMDQSDPADYLRQLREYGYRLYDDTEYARGVQREYEWDGAESTVNLFCVPG